MSIPLRVADPADPGSNVLRAPPHNYEGERALLGAILMNNRAYERVSDFLAPGHFADPVNGRIYDCCSREIAQGHQANPVTLKTMLQHDDLVIAAGGIKYLANLAAGAVTVINAGDYGRLIYDLYLRRELIAMGEDLVNDAYEPHPDESANDLIDKFETQAFSLRSDGTAQGGLKDFDDVADETLLLAERAYQHDGALVGVTTGLRDLDKKLAGLQPSDLLILAGRPSMGKTALATTIAFNAAKYFQTTDRPEHRGKKVAFFSLEMSGDQLMTRVLAQRAKLNSFAIRAGKLNETEFSNLVLARNELRDTHLKIDDTPSITVGQIRSRSRRLAREEKNGAGGLGLIVIDYLQLIASIGKDRSDNRVQEISLITRGLKALAKELGVPVLALSQLSRGVEQREDKRPVLSDLRDSGSIEQDSDIVMFVYREQYYLERNEPKQRVDEGAERFVERYGKWEDMINKAHNTGECIVAKQRQGPLGTVHLDFEPSNAAWTDQISALLPIEDRLI